MVRLKILSSFIVMRKRHLVLWFLVLEMGVCSQIQVDCVTYVFEVLLCQMIELLHHYSSLFETLLAIQKGLEIFHAKHVLVRLESLLPLLLLLLIHGVEQGIEFGLPGLVELGLHLGKFCVGLLDGQGWHMVL